MVARATLAALLDNFSRQGVGQHVQTAATLLAANTQTHVAGDGFAAPIIMMTEELLSKVAFGHSSSKLDQRCRLPSLSRRGLSGSPSTAGNTSRCPLNLTRATPACCCASSSDRALATRRPYEYGNHEGALTPKLA